MKKKNRYAVVDLEATETGSQANIIQIGIVMVEEGQIVATYETDVNPHEKISSHIKQLTGLTDERLAQAPDFGEVALEIYQLIKDAIFVAHNVRFDANLLAEALFFEGFELRTPRVDTVELSQVFFPTFEKYNLSFLARELNLDLDQAHSAISDAHATAQLLLAIQDKIGRLPKETVHQILDLSDSFLFESRLVIEEVYERMSEVLPDQIKKLGGVFLRKEEELPSEQLLVPDFEANRARLQLEARERQMEFVRCIESRLEAKEQVHFIQAQAGIGKTYGYLLPLLARANQDLLVAVPTKILQHQIVEKEGKALRDVFHLSVTSVKAARHYLDLATFFTSLQEESENSLVDRMKLAVLVWLCETKTGDLDELKQTYRSPAYFDRIRHRGIVAEDSLFYEGDFWRRLHSQAQKSRVVLTNHAYLLHHVKDQEYLFANRIVVLDEVQKLLLAAEEMASQTISFSTLLNQMDRLQEETDSILDQRLLESCHFEMEMWQRERKGRARYCLDGEMIEQVEQNLSELSFLSPDLLTFKWLLETYDQFWLETDRESGEVLLRASQWDFLEVASLLPQAKTFCISAGLDLGKGVSLPELLGFEDSTIDLLSSQKNQQQQVFLLEEGLDFVESDLGQQAAAIRDCVLDLLAVEKPILVLFTSVVLLQRVSERLEESEVAHLAQHRHGEEGLLKRRFEKGEAPILLATGQFWEGVDFAEHKEMIQVIPRLPFENPSDFFVQKMNRHLKGKGKQPFYDYGLPMMLLRLRQAMGRTKRFEQQVSAVVLLDNRTKTKRYSKKIRSFLRKEEELDTVQRDQLAKKIIHFFKNKG